MQTFGINATITRYLGDDPQPGIVECQFVDALGRRWSFIEKTAIVSADALTAQSHYPRACRIACEVIGRRKDDAGREVVRVDTARPWGMESMEGNTQFEVYSELLSELL